MKTISFSTNAYPFERLIEQLFACSELRLLHKLDPDKHSDLFKVGADSSTVFHSKFYDKYHVGWPEMEALYECFISEMIAPLFKEDVLYQKFPTIRFHLPANVAVGAFHNDAEFNHPKGEMNFIIPLTESEDTASVWVESEPGKKDFKAMKMKPGRVIMFNGNELTHGNKVNDTGLTRVSMDFRILPVSCYHPTEAGSVTLGTKFKEGAYYKRLIKS